MKKILLVGLLASLAACSHDDGKSQTSAQQSQYAQQQPGMSQYAQPQAPVGSPAAAPQGQPQVLVWDANSQQYVPAPPQYQPQVMQQQQQPVYVQQPQQPQVVVVQQPQQPQVVQQDHGVLTGALVGGAVGYIAGRSSATPPHPSYGSGYGYGPDHRTVIVQKKTVIVNKTVQAPAPAAPRGNTSYRRYYGSSSSSSGSSRSSKSYYRRK